jgi:hypothetical protein
MIAPLKKTEVTPVMLWQWEGMTVEQIEDSFGLGSSDLRWVRQILKFVADQRGTQTLYMSGPCIECGLRKIRRFIRGGTCDKCRAGGVTVSIADFPAIEPLPPRDRTIPEIPITEDMTELERERAMSRNRMRDADRVQRLERTVFRWADDQINRSARKRPRRAGR